MPASRGVTDIQRTNRQSLSCGDAAKLYKVQVRMDGKDVGWFVGIAIFAVVISSAALSQQSLQQLESASQFEQALAAVI